jgi:hypothetical protein
LVKKAAERPGGEGRRQVDAEAERARLESFLIESKLSVLTHIIRRAGVSSLAELVRPLLLLLLAMLAGGELLQTPGDTLAWCLCDLLIWPRDSLTW